MLPGFRASFSKNMYGKRVWRSIKDWSGDVWRWGEPNKPNWVKELPINKILRDQKKQTKCCYHPFYQWLTLILPTIFDKYESIASSRTIKDSGPVYRSPRDREAQRRTRKSN